MALRGRNKVSPNFNMSSMTDIVFLLLIFFMLTSTLVSPNALNLLLPNSNAKAIEEKQNISIFIDEISENEIKIYLDEDEIGIQKDTISISLDEKIILLEQKLKKRITKKNNEVGIILLTDHTIDVQHVVSVMDIAYRNKYKMVLATNPK
jgi:biopolymer transport protein ExbD